MSSFNSKKNKISDLWNQDEINNNNTNKLERLTIKLNPIIFNKKIIEISILENYPVEFDSGGIGG